MKNDLSMMVFLTMLLMNPTVDAASDLWPEIVEPGSVNQGDVADESQGDADESPRIEFDLDDGEIDLGVIRPNIASVRIIRFRNSGSGNLVIGRITADSDSVAVVPPRAVIPPGQTGELIVTATIPMAIPHRETRRIELTIPTNDPMNRLVRQVLTIRVVPEIELDRWQIDFTGPIGQLNRSIKPDRPGSANYHDQIWKGDPKPSKVRKFGNPPPERIGSRQRESSRVSGEFTRHDANNVQYLTLSGPGLATTRIEEPVTVTPFFSVSVLSRNSRDRELRIKVALHDDTPPGIYDDYLVIRTDNPSCPVLPVSLHARVGRRVAFSPEGFEFHWDRDRQVAIATMTLADSTWWKLEVLEATVLAVNRITGGDYPVGAILPLPVSTVRVELSDDKDSDRSRVSVLIDPRIAADDVIVGSVELTTTNRVESRLVLTFQVDGRRLNRERVAAVSPSL